jgi:hypothetical protein
MKLFIYLGCLLIIISCKEAHSKNFESAQVVKDSIKVLMDQDYYLNSTKFHKKVFLDYKRQSEYKKLYYKADSIFSYKNWVENLFISERPCKENFIKNKYNNLLKNYISISKLNGAYIFFTQNVDDYIFSLVNLNDTTFNLIDLQGLYVFYYQNIEYSNNKYLINFFQNKTYSDKIRIEIRVIDKENDIQIWRITKIKKDGETPVYYELKAPLDYALKLPILVIENTGGLDPIYDDIDKIDLEKLFN